MEAQYQQLLDSKMCSGACDCVATSQAIWQTQNDADLRTKFKRTNNPTSAELSAYRNGNPANFNGITPLTFTGTNTKFPDCEESIKQAIDLYGSS